LSSVGSVVRDNLRGSMTDTIVKALGDPERDNDATGKIDCLSVCDSMVIHLLDHSGCCQVFHQAKCSG